MLTETLLKIPFSVIGRCSLVPTTHWLQGKYLLVTGGYRYVFTESLAASSMHFHCKAVPFLEVFSKLVSNFKGAS